MIKSFKEENIAIAGVPAKRISSVDTFILLHLLYRLLS
jgi:hypothetical protein